MSHKKLLQTIFSEIILDIGLNFFINQMVQRDLEYNKFERMGLQAVEKVQPWISLMEQHINICYSNSC